MLAAMSTETASFPHAPNDQINGECVVHRQTTYQQKELDLYNFSLLVLKLCVKLVIFTSPVISPPPEKQTNKQTKKDVEALFLISLGTTITPRGN